MFNLGDDPDHHLDPVIFRGFIISLISNISAVLGFGRDMQSLSDLSLHVCYLILK